MIPAYVGLGLLIAFVLLRMWDDAGKDPEGAAQGSETPASEPAPWDPGPSARLALIGVTIAAGFLVYIFPTIVINAVWPEETPWDGPCVERIGAPSADATPQERAGLEAAAWMDDQLRAQGAPYCAAGPRPLGGLEYTTSGSDLGQ